VVVDVLVDGATVVVVVVDALVVLVVVTATDALGSVDVDGAVSTSVDGEQATPAVTSTAVRSLTRMASTVPGARLTGSDLSPGHQK
jgi:hypothetical protein